MRKKQLFMWLAAASTYTGIGMVLGYVFGDKVQTAPAYLGAVLIFLGAILLGMFISSRGPAATNPPATHPESSTPETTGHSSP